MRHVALRMLLVARQVNVGKVWWSTATCANDHTCHFIRCRPLVFAVGDADGNLHVYDLKRSRGRPEVTLKVRVADLVTCYSSLLRIFYPCSSRR